MQGETTPSWDVVLINEDPHDGKVCNWALTQDGRVSVDREARVIKHDISDHKVHAHNQTKNSNKRLWDMLLYNQST